MNLSISGLSKTYPNGVAALRNVSLTISSGIFGLLGPNGAGKSTLMRILATLQAPDSGTVHLGELDLLEQKYEVRRQLGYLPQEFGLYPRISAESMLNHLAVLKGIRNTKNRREVVQAVLHKTNLFLDRKKNLGGFSGGMKQRFGIAQALLANPQLLIIDEPTAGLDPTERNRFHNLLSELAEETIVILSTHIVDDVKELCCDMAILLNGEILLQAPPLAAINAFAGKVYQKSIGKSEMPLYRQQYRVISEKLFLGQPVIHVLSDTHPRNGFRECTVDLEDVYFAQVIEQNMSRAERKYHAV